MNFGATPFRFPFEDYKPLQDKPITDLLKAQDLTQALDKLMPAVSYLRKNWI